jgi:hypothetical protein
MSKTGYLRETKYAGLISEGILEFADQQELRVERLHIKNRGTQEIRFSWWKNGGIIPRPMDATEDELINLFNKGIRAGVFTPNFCQRLKQLL